MCKPNVIMKICGCLVPKPFAILSFRNVEPEESKLVLKSTSNLRESKWSASYKNMQGSLLAKYTQNCLLDKYMK